MFVITKSLRTGLGQANLRFGGEFQRQGRGWKRLKTWMKSSGHDVLYTFILHLYMYLYIYIYWDKNSMVLLMVQKSCTSWYVVYPIIYRMFIHWWCRISEPSTEEVEKSKPIGSYEFTIKNHHPFTRSFICLSWRLPRPWFYYPELKNINLHGTHCEPVAMGRTQVGMK